jgi:hypothetical protein
MLIDAMTWFRAVRSWSDARRLTAGLDTEGAQRYELTSAPLSGGL